MPDKNWIADETFWDEAWQDMEGRLARPRGRRYWPWAVAALLLIVVLVNQSGGEHSEQLRPASSPPASTVLPSPVLSSTEARRTNQARKRPSLGRREQLRPASPPLPSTEARRTSQGRERPSLSQGEKTSRSAQLPNLKRQEYRPVSNRITPGPILSAPKQNVSPAEDFGITPRSELLLAAFLTTPHEWQTGPGGQMTYRHPIRSGKLSWSASAAYLRRTFNLLPDGKGNEAFLVFQDVNVNSSGPTGGGNATVTVEPASIGALSLEAGIGYRFGRRLHLDLSAGAGYLLASELNTVAQVLPIGAGNRGVQFQSTLAEVDTGFDPSLRRWQPVVGASVSYAPLARWSVRAGYRYRPLDLFSAPGYRAPRSSFRLGVGFRIR